MRFKRVFRRDHCVITQLVIAPDVRKTSHYCVARGLNDEIKRFRNRKCRSNTDGRRRVVNNLADVKRRDIGKQI
jgi:hypothetical protein